MVISKSFRGQLVVPEFGAFTSDIQDIYYKYVVASYELKCISNTNLDVSPTRLGSRLTTSLNWREETRPSGGSVFAPRMVSGFLLGMSRTPSPFSQPGISLSSRNCFSSYFSKPFTYALSLDQLGAEVVQKYIGREPSGRTFNEIAVDYNGQDDKM